MVAADEFAELTPRQDIPSSSFARSAASWGRRPGDMSARRLPRENPTTPLHPSKGGHAVALPDGCVLLVAGDLLRMSAFMTFASPDLVSYVLYCFLCS